MSVIDAYDLKQVARFVDGINKLTRDTGVVLYADGSNAQLRVHGGHVGLRLADEGAENDGYCIEIAVGDDVDD